MDEQHSTNGNTVAGMQIQALTYQAHNRTVRLIDRTNEEEGGSAVPVAIGPRTFLATAAHVIPKGHSFEVVPSPGERPITQFVGHFRDEERDVGVLEIRAEDKSNLCEERFCTEGMILSLADSGRGGMHVIVVGYPGQYIAPVGRKVRDVDGRRVEETMLTCNAYPYHGFTIPTSQWPTDDRRPPLASGDIFIRYDPGRTCRPYGPSHAGSPWPRAQHSPPKLEGLSGGGIWLMRHSQSEGAWPRSPSLIGIQTGVYRKAGVLRGTLIGHWLDLVVSNYPDLQEAIHSIRTGDG